MLRRDRQIRTVIHQAMDACLFAVSFWLAYRVRSNPHFIGWLRLGAPSPFESFAWLWLVLIPVAPAVLESQGFYDRGMLCPRRAIWWPLFKGCLLTTVGLVLVLYFFGLILARPVMVLF